MIKLGWDGPKIRFQFDKSMYFMEIVMMVAIALMLSFVAAIVIYGTRKGQPSTKYVVTVEEGYTKLQYRKQIQIDAERNFDEFALTNFTSEGIAHDIKQILQTNKISTVEVRPK